MVLKSFAGAGLRVACTALVLLALAPILLAAPKPEWWAKRGVTNSKPADDFAVANLGQLKQMAAKARDELNAALSNQGGAGPAIDAMIASFGVNLTQHPGVTASQSSTEFRGVASRAIDNNTDGNYAHASVTHTGGPNITDGAVNLAWQDPWWQVGLGAVRIIRSVEIWNRTDEECGLRATNLYVLISNAPMGGIPLSTLLEMHSVWKSEKIVTPPSPNLRIPVGNQPGRYVMICIEGAQYLHLAEVKVIGVSNTAALPCDDFAAATLGQLKTVAKPFYDRLSALRLSDDYPWRGQFRQPDDLALANIGQLKELFSFDLSRDTDGDGIPDILEVANQMDPRVSDLTLDTDGDGIPDAWEIAYGMNRLYAGDKMADLDHDGVSNFAEYNAHTDPTDYFNGRRIQISLISGGGQSVEPNDYVPRPIRVRLLESDGSPIPHAPVNFIAGRGRVSLNGTSRKAKSDNLSTDADGYAQTNFITSSLPGDDFVQVIAGHQSLNVVSVVDYNLPPAAPSNFEHKWKADGGVRFSWHDNSWQDNSPNEVCFFIQRSYGGEEWRTVAIVAPHIRTFDISEPIQVEYYRVKSAYNPE